MNIEPLFATGFEWLSTSRPQLDLMVAGGIFVGTIAYMTRVAGISFAYGLSSKARKENRDLETPAK